MDSTIEKQYLKQGYDLIVGIDEVGRGPWAGPLYLCGYCFDPHSKIFDNVDDSKKVSKLNRKNLYENLRLNSYKIESISTEIIDAKGLGKAITDGLGNIITNIRIPFKDKKVKFLVDGYFKGEWGDDVEFISKGDEIVYSIACASIIAKVERDEFMNDLHEKYPEYGFDTHVGYGTKKHVEALEKFGIIEGVHRVSFKPVKKFIF